jgi:hypothetical protein
MRRVLLAAAVLALVPSTAAAKFHFRSLGVATRAAVTDGERYAVFPTKHALVLVDAGSAKLKLKRLPLRKCPLAGGDPYWYVVGAGRIGVGCAYQFFLRGFSGGKMVKPPYIQRPGGYFDAVDDGSEGDEVRTHAVGTQWLEADVSTMDGSDFRRFLNWHTGQSRSDSTRADENANLDDPALFQPLCAPLQRVALPSFEAPSGFYAYSYDGHFGVTLRYGGPAVGSNPRHQLAIQACGQPEPTVVSNCEPSCLYVQYGSGMLSWSEGPRVFGGTGRLVLRVARTGREYRWKSVDDGGLSFAIAHTRRWVFLQSCRHENCRVVAASIPR